jgi:hypothetical protein
MTHRYKVNPQDKQTGLTGKSENDTNKLGKEKPTQKNEGRRTAQSRHDREGMVGGVNQHKVRAGAPQKGPIGASKTNSIGPSKR